MKTEIRQNLHSFNKQITNNEQHRSGNLEEQPLLFSFACQSWLGV